MSALRQDFQKKKFKNPYYSPKKKGSVFFKNKQLMAVFFVIFIFGLVGLSRISVFKIENIKISGTDFISEAEINQIASDQINKSRFLIFPQSNIVFFSKNQLKKAILEKYYLNHLTINKDYWHQITIEIEEKPIKLIYSANQKKYFIDENGTIINEYGPGKSDKKEVINGLEIVRPNSQAQNLLVVNDKNNQDIQIGFQVLGKDDVNFILSLDKILKDEADFKINDYSLPEGNKNDLMVLTNQGWEIRFNMKDSYQSQTRLLFLILKDKVKDRATLDYIDLRFGDKIYYQ